MIIWNIEKLKTRLIEDNITEFQYLWYMILQTLLVYLYYQFAITKHEEIILPIIYSVVNILPLYACFIFHKRYNMKGFIEKFIAVSFVAFVRYMAIIILITVVITLALIAYGTYTSKYEEIGNIILIFSQRDSPQYITLDVFFMLLYVLYISKHYRNLAQRSKKH